MNKYGDKGDCFWHCVKWQWKELSDVTTVYNDVTFLCFACNKGAFILTKQAIKLLIRKPFQDENPSETTVKWIRVSAVLVIKKTVMRTEQQNGEEVGFVVLSATECNLKSIYAGVKGKFLERWS
jgi:hypothetical protein